MDSIAKTSMVVVVSFEVRNVVPVIKTGDQEGY